MPTFFHENAIQYALLPGVNSTLSISNGGYWAVKLPPHISLAQKRMLWLQVTQTLCHFSTSVALYTMLSSDEVRVYCIKDRKPDVHGVLRSIWNQGLTLTWGWFGNYAALPENAQWQPSPVFE